MRRDLVRLICDLLTVFNMKSIEPSSTESCFPVVQSIFRVTEQGIESQSRLVTYLKPGSLLASCV